MLNHFCQRIYRGANQAMHSCQYFQIGHTHAKNQFLPQAHSFNSHFTFNRVKEIADNDEFLISKV